MPPSVRIIGAGIAGLTAAIALNRAGLSVNVFERSPELAPVGAAIVLAPNAIYLLNQLGVDLASAGQPIDKVCIRDSRGRKIQESDLSNLPAPFTNALALDRAELHQRLLNNLPPNCVHLGEPYTAQPLSQNEILIGADGISSTVRASIPNAPKVIYSGQTCWRAICPNPGVNETFEEWGTDGCRVGVVPLNRNRIYIFLVKTASPKSPRIYQISQIRSHFERFSPPVPAILETLANIPLLHRDLDELAEPIWGMTNTLLIGDAAHAMTPNLGQGASMAIEDAVVLPQARAAADPAQELKRLRHARVSNLQLNSRRLGQLAHWQRPWACHLRNALLRAIPQSLGARSYRRMLESGINTV